MSSDSSDDDITQRVREVVIDPFLNQDKIREKPDQEATKHTAVKDTQHSNAPQYGLFRVTPQFRQHVSKHLYKIMDKALEGKFKKIAKPSTDSDCERLSKESEKVKLFADSKSPIDTEEEHAIVENDLQIIKKRKKSRNVENSSISSGDEDDEDIMEKCRQVAVDPEWILSKKGTEHWSTRSKAPVYEYKQTEDGLVLINSS